MIKYSGLVAVIVLGLLSVPSMAQSTCNGGANCPDVLIDPISATGFFNDLSDEDNIKILVGNSFDIELLLDGTTFPAVDVTSADLQLDVVGGAGLNCGPFSVDTNRADKLLATCSLCQAACGPPHRAGLLDFAGTQLVNYLAYMAEMTLTCKQEGSFTLEFGGTFANNVIGALGAPDGFMNIRDDPSHFESINVECFLVQGQCCQGNDCLDGSCAIAGGTTTTSAVACAACGGSWTVGDSCSDPCLCDFNADCDDNDACTDNICQGNGICSFPPTAASVACDGQNDPPCASFECNTGTGACDDLSAANNGVSCDDGFVCTGDDLCAAGVCSGPLRANTFVCRADAGECDVADTCDGLTPTCPPNAFESEFTPCGDPDATDCNAADSCNASGSCIARFKASSFVCRADDGECDIEETCDGVSAICPADEPDPEFTSCGDPDSTNCNDADSCNASGSCIARFRPLGFVCRADAGDCDVAETCDGVTVICPPEVFEPEFTSCGDPDTANCNDADSCDASGNCINRIRALGFICRADAGECDVEETCDGSLSTCPVNAFEPEFTTCGDPDTTDCNAADSCNASGSCIDRVKLGDVCRSDAGECDVEETCDGVSAVCPADDSEPEFTPCGDPDFTDCNAADSCDASGTCIGRFKAGGFVCRSDAGDCDVEETCTGVSAACPAEVFEPNGTACTDEPNDCTNDICEDGACIHPDLPDGTTCADEGNDCTENLCQTGVCTHPILPDETECSQTPGGPVNGQCTDGICTGCFIPAPIVDGNIASRFIRVRMNALPDFPIAMRITNLCDNSVGWVQLVDDAVDDGTTGTISVAIATAGNDCTVADFLTPSQWGPGQVVYVKGTTITPEANFRVDIMCDDCLSFFSPTPGSTSQCTWRYADVGGDGQVTFAFDLFKMFLNTAAAGSPFYLGDDPGYEVDVQGQQPKVPDGQVTFSDDLLSALEATQVGGLENWDGPLCPETCP